MPNAAHAQVVLTAADSNTGADGAPGTGNPHGPGQFIGNFGQDGYLGNRNSSYIINDPTFRGGAGGKIIGTDATAGYLGGNGGDGLFIYNADLAVNSGIFTGGIGGAADGIGNFLDSGRGGDGLHAVSDTTNVYGGTFQGGNSGIATGSNNTGSGGAGSGLSNNSASDTVNVFGGSFTGGDDMVTPFQSDVKGGAGLFNQGGTMNIYGGTFTEGKNGFGDILVGNGLTTIYGSFTVDAITGFGNPLTDHGAVSGYTGPLTGRGTITGIFQNNTTATTFTYDVIGGGSLNIAPAAVPEASTMVSFGLLFALGLGGAVAAARRRKAAGAT